MLAAQSGPIVPIYVIEPKIVNSSDFDAMHWQFIRESLQDLQASLKNLGVPLQIMKGDEKFRFSKLWAHEETGNGITYKRDQAVAGWAVDSNIQFIELPQNGVVRRLQDRDGWSHEWERRMHVRQFDTPEDISCPDGLMVCPVPSISELRLKQTLRETDVNGGESAGMEMLSSFIESRGHSYH